MELEVENPSVEHASKSKDEPILNFMKEIKAFSDWIHMWPRQGGTNLQKIKHKIIAWSNFIYLNLFVSSFIVHIIAFYKNMDGIAEAVDHVTVYISGTFRYLYMYLRSKKYLKLLEMIRTGFINRPMFSNDGEDILRRYFQRARYLIILYNAPVVFWNLQVVIQPVLHYVVGNIKKGLSNEVNQTEVNFRVPIAAYFPMDIEKPPGTVFFYFWEMYGIIIVGIIYMCVDDFWVMTIMFTISQFEILKKSYENILEFPQDDEYPEKVELLDEDRKKQLKERLKKCLKHHSFLREFIHLSDDLFNPNVLMDYFHATISIAFLLLEVTITIKTGRWGSFSHALQYLIVSIVHMFLFNWLANELSVKEEDLCDTICSLPWYKFPSEKNSILLEVLISKRPHGLSGGKTFKLTLSFFTVTVRVIFSYFTFLLQMRNQTEIEEEYMTQIQ